MCFLLSSNQNYSILLTSTIWESNEITICIFIANWGAFPFLGFNSIQDLFETYLSWNESRADHISLEKGRINKASMMRKDDLCTDLFKRSRLFTQIARGNKSLSARNPQTRHRHLLWSRRQHKRLSAFVVKVVEAETFRIPDWVCTNGEIGLCLIDWQRL